MARSHRVDTGSTPVAAAIVHTPVSSNGSDGRFSICRSGFDSPYRYHVREKGLKAGHSVRGGGITWVRFPLLPPVEACRGADRKSGGGVAQSGTAATEIQRGPPQVSAANRAHRSVRRHDTSEEWAKGEPPDLGSGHRASSILASSTTVIVDSTQRMSRGHVTLSVDTLRWLLDVADARNRYKHPSRSRRRSTEYSDLQLDYLGVKGEYVTAHVYDAAFDATGYCRRGDSGVDILTPTPGAIKTNHRAGGYLLIERWSDLAKVDIVHLVDGPCAPPNRCGCAELPSTDDEIWRYVGWMAVAEFRARSTLANWGLGPRRFVRQNQLTRTLHRA